MARTIHGVLQLHLEYSHCPAVLDLSKEHTFDALLKVRRTHTDTDLRPITLLTTGSVLEPRVAFRNGYFKLTEARENGGVISVQDESESDKIGGNENTVSIEEAPDDAFVTLPSRAGGRGDLQRRIHYDVVIPLRLAERFREELIPGRTYNLNPAGDALGIKWWSYGSKENLLKSLPASEPAKLSAQRVSGKVNFLAVSSLASPPSISVSLSLSSSVVRRAEDSPPTLRMEVTNSGNKPITLKTAGQQPHIRPDTSLPEPFPWRSIAAPSPSLENFCIRRVPSGEDCIHPRVVNVSYIGREGWKRQGFTTLAPNEPLIREIPFLENASGVVNRMGDDGEFCIKLRGAELWWCYGTVEEIFGDKNDIRVLPNFRTLPIIPHGENELTFRLES